MRIPLPTWILITRKYAFARVRSLPGIERVFPGDDVRAVPSHQHLDAVVERADSGLGRRALLDDLQRVPGASAQGTVLAGTLNAAVWVHAVCQPI